MLIISTSLFNRQVVKLMLQSQPFFQLFGMERYFILTTIIESIFDRSPWQCGIISVVSDDRDKPNPQYFIQKEKKQLKIINFPTKVIIRTSSCYLYWLIQLNGTAINSLKRTKIVGILSEKDVPVKIFDSQSLLYKTSILSETQYQL